MVLELKSYTFTMYIVNVMELDECFTVVLVFFIEIY